MSPNVSFQHQGGPSGCRIGMGSTGYTGCMHVSGQGIHWPIFHNKSSCIFVAMDMLKLDLIGLPGARLHESFALPDACAFRCFARGGLVTVAALQSGGKSFREVLCPSTLWDRAAGYGSAFYPNRVQRCCGVSFTFQQGRARMLKCYGRRK